MKEYELKYFVGEDEIESVNALMMLTNRLAVVVDETKHGEVIHVHMQPTIH